MSSTVADRQLASAERRAHDPGEYFGSLEVEVFGGDADHAAAFEHFRTRADAVLDSFSKAAPLPRFGESIIGYRRRLFDIYKPYTRYKETPSHSLDRVGLNSCDEFVRKDVNAYLDGLPAPREYVYRDDSDRKIRGWRGGPPDWAWLPFTNETTQGQFVNGKYVPGQYIGPKIGRINCEMGRGPDGPEARALRERENARLAAAFAALDAAQAAAGAGAAGSG
jgi:hypothetical protein